MSRARATRRADGAASRRAPLIEVRKSPVHGLGVFAARRIRKGTRVIEYLGERVSHREADGRYEDRDADDNHTFLFIVDSRTVIDAGVNGNDARFVNHACDPNCESTVEARRVFIDAIRTIEPGEELTYDYQIQREPDDPPDVDVIFACRCGAAGCRGTMLWPPQPPQHWARSARRQAGGRRSADQAGRRRERGTDARARQARTAARRR